jgi:hypothetical protein
MQIINASLDLNKIDKNKIVTTDKNGKPFQNGSKYLNVSIIIHDQPDKYGNHASIAHSQTKEEREAKSDKVYLGNGKIVWKSQQDNKQNEQTTSSDTLPF